MFCTCECTLAVQHSVAVVHMQASVRKASREWSRCIEDGDNPVVLFATGNENVHEKEDEAYYVLCSRLRGTLHWDRQLTYFKAFYIHAGKVHIIVTVSNALMIAAKIQV